jgi:hypothetical protein
MTSPVRPIPWCSKKPSRSSWSRRKRPFAERVERRLTKKEASTKRFVNLLQRSIATDEAIAKARLLEVNDKTKSLEAEAKARLLEAKSRTQLLEAEAKTMLMAEENNIILTNLDSISDPCKWEWFENRQKMIRECEV